MRVMNKSIKFKLMSHYTRAELKVIKDLSLSDSVVALQLNRSRQAVYCKRWAMGLLKRKRNRRSKLQDTVPVSDTVVQEVVKGAVGNSVERVVLGNVTIDLVSRTLTVHF
jgi:hypothetical protein